MKTFMVILLSLFLITACSNSIKEVAKPKGRIITVSYLVEVEYTNGDIDTLNVEYYTGEFNISGLNLAQSNGVSYISCENCKDEYLREIQAIVADVRKYKIIDRNIALN